MLEKPLPSLLVVEDSDEDFETFVRIVDRSCEVEVPLVRCIDGDDALDFLYHKGDYATTAVVDLPGLILLDLNLPGTDGRDVLATIKQDDHLKLIPVVVLTTSSNPVDIETCYQFGANSYLVKPTNIEQFKFSVQQLMDYWFGVSILPDV